MSSTELTVVPPPPPKILCQQQGEIRIEFDDNGNVSIVQRNWLAEDDIIFIASDNVQTFLDALCDALGVQTFGGSR
jgi:hypothetical protein